MFTSGGGKSKMESKMLYLFLSSSCQDLCSTTRKRLTLRSERRKPVAATGARESSEGQTWEANWCCFLGDLLKSLALPKGFGGISLKDFLGSNSLIEQILVKDLHSQDR